MDVTLGPRLPLEMCPLCGKADAVARSCSQSAQDMDMSVTLVVPDRMCGRCLIQPTRAALEAAQREMARMRGIRA